MKGVLSIAFAAIVASGSAMAADIPVKAPVLKAPPPAVWSWDGFYIGGHVGYSWGDWDSFCPYTNCFVANSGSFITPNVAGNAAALAAFLASFTNSASPSVDGWVAGVHAGRNWQHQSWVVGLEGDFSWTGEKDEQAGTVAVGIIANDARLNTTVTVANEWKLHWLATFRGRAGWVVGSDNSWLIYGTGGLAIGRVGYKSTTTITVATANLANTVTTASATATTALSERDTAFGWVAGAGIEKMFTKNWVARVEYLYVDLGEHTFFENVVGPLGRADTEVKLRDHIVRVGLSYKFDPYVVAKY